MRLVAPERCIALVNRADFLRAKELVENFDQWEAFEDYLDDREGLWMGLAFAGLSVPLASISLDPFLAWCGTNGEPATAERLDEFATLTQALRRSRLQRQGNDRNDREPLVNVPVDLQAYEAWAAYLRKRPSSTLLEAFAQFTVEAWFEVDVPEFFVG